MEPDTSQQPKEIRQLQQEPPKQKTKERETFQTVVIGTNGTGKTTIIKKIVIAALKAGQRVLVVTPDFAEWLTLPEIHERYRSRIEWYKGGRRMIYQEGDLKLINDHFRNGLIVFDDCRSYLDARTSKEIHNLVIRRRQFMVDLIFVAHGFTEIPPKFFTFASQFIIFKTRDSIDIRKKELGSDFENIKQVVNTVNAEAVKDKHFYKIVKR
jgi:ABC-type polar amino acid transport system ATPase subunit